MNTFFNHRRLVADVLNSLLVNRSELFLFVLANDSLNKGKREKGATAIHSIVLEFATEKVEQRSALMLVTETSDNEIIY